MPVYGVVTPSSIVSTLNPTSSSVNIEFFDDFQAYQQSTANGSFGYWITSSGTDSAADRNSSELATNRRGLYRVTGGTSTGYAGVIGDNSFGILLGGMEITIACALGGLVGSGVAYIVFKFLHSIPIQQ